MTMSGEMQGPEDEMQGLGGSDLAGELEQIGRASEQAEREQEEQRRLMHEMGSSVALIVDRLPSHPLTMPERSLGEVVDELPYGEQTEPILLTEPGAPGVGSYVFGRYGADGAHSSMMVNAQSPDGHGLSTWYSIGEVDAEGRTGVKREKMDLSTQESWESWLDAEGVQMLRDRLAALEKLIYEDKFVSEAAE
jgi:hypothetical protein